MIYPFTSTAFEILEVFLEKPTQDFSIRGISRELTMSHATVLKHMNDLETLGIVKRRATTLYPVFSAHTEHKLFRSLQASWLTLRLRQSGILEYLHKNLLPSCVVLYGSASKGTLNELSDIDLYVQAKRKKLNVGTYEKKLRRKIHFLFESKFKDLNKELRNNIINGIVVDGYLKGA